MFLQILDLTHLCNLSYLLLLFINDFDIWIRGFDDHWLDWGQLCHCVLLIHDLLHRLLLEHDLVAHLLREQVLLRHLRALPLVEPRIHTAHLVHLQHLIVRHDTHVQQFLKRTHQGVGCTLPVRGVFGLRGRWLLSLKLQTVEMSEKLPSHSHKH